MDDALYTIGNYGNQSFDFAVYCRSCFCYRSIGIGTKNGFRIFAITSAEKLEAIHDNGTSTCMFSMSPM